jgi:peptide chain release factor 1
MDEKIDKIISRYAEIERLMAEDAVISDARRLRELAREHAQLAPMVEVSRKLKKVREDISENRLIIDKENDRELVELAEEELDELQEKERKLTEELKTLLIPPDPMDSKNIIMEIRAGTGGEEAALFAADLFRMYCHYIESRGWRHELISLSPAERGGLKEVIFSVSGRGVYGRLKYESGVHRVQRVPATESSGRIHTSAATVAVLPEAEEVDVVINPADLKIDVFRSSGPGGQSVNTTDSAVRVTYLPTQLVVTCQDEKSQLKNKNKALKVLRSRLLDMKIQEINQKRAVERRLQVGSGDRSAKIRTYNFPQSRVTDHRIGFTTHRLEDFLNGALDGIIEALALASREEALEKGHAGSDQH